MNAQELSEADVRKNFPVLTPMEREGSRLYGIQSFDGNDPQTDKDRELGMAAAFRIVERCGPSLYAPGGLLS
jgi:hypothetical protein